MLEALEAPATARELVGGAWLVLGGDPQPPRAYTSARRHGGRGGRRGRVGGELESFNGAGLGTEAGERRAEFEATPVGRARRGRYSLEDPARDTGTSTRGLTSRVLISFPLVRGAVVGAALDRSMRQSQPASVIGAVDVDASDSVELVPPVNPPSTVRGHASAAHEQDTVTGAPTGTVTI